MTRRTALGMIGAGLLSAAGAVGLAGELPAAKAIVGAAHANRWDWQANRWERVPFDNLKLGDLFWFGSNSPLYFAADDAIPGQGVAV